MQEPPFYRQGLDFTCGPACLLMAMAALTPGRALAFPEEAQIWREATLGAVPATSRHGLALAAVRRGYGARLVATTPGIPYAKMMEAHVPSYYREGDAHLKLHEETRRLARAAGIAEEVRAVTVTDVTTPLARGEQVLFLTSARLFGDDSPTDIPHWVLATRADARGVLVLNPLADAPPRETLDEATLTRALGFAGESELVILTRGERAQDTEPAAAARADE